MATAGLMSCSPKEIFGSSWATTHATHSVAKTQSVLDFDDFKAFRDDHVVVLSTEVPEDLLRLRNFLLGPDPHGTPRVRQSMRRANNGYSSKSTLGGVNSARQHHRRGKGSFLIRFDAERINGQRRQRCVTIRGSYKDAQRELAKLLASADVGALPSRDTVSAYLRNWLDSTLKQSPKTLERYRELAERQILPHFGELKIQKLTPEHLEKWHATLIKGGLSARTVGHAHRVLSAALTRAVEMERCSQCGDDTQTANGRGAGN